MPRLYIQGSNVFEQDVAHLFIPSKPPFFLIFIAQRLFCACRLLFPETNGHAKKPFKIFQTRPGTCGKNPNLTQDTTHFGNHDLDFLSPISNNVLFGKDTSRMM
jgi:hypothetical protein